MPRGLLRRGRGTAASPVTFHGAIPQCVECVHRYGVTNPLSCTNLMGTPSERGTRSGQQAGQFAGKRVRLGQHQGDIYVNFII